MSDDTFSYDLTYAVLQGFGIQEDKRSTTVPFVFENKEYTISHGSVVIAAITSCTNTSNPSVMLGAGKFVSLCICLYVCLLIIQNIIYPMVLL